MHNSAEGGAARPSEGVACRCRDNPKHTCTQREGPTVREDHLHLWLDKERCRSTHWNALLPYRRIQQSVCMVCKRPTLIIIHDTPFMEVYTYSTITRTLFIQLSVYLETKHMSSYYKIMLEISTVRFFIANKRLH